MLKHRDKKGGIVAGTIFGIGGLIIGVIVVLIITSTIGNANLITDDKTATYTKLNESITFGATNTPQTLSVSTLPYLASCNALTYIANETTTGAGLGLTNITQTNCNLINATALGDFIGNGTVYVSYTYTITDTYSKDVVTGMRGNLTSGIDNVSQKIPTILLIIAVVLLFGVLVLLVRQAGLMGIGGGNSGGSL
jgi:hypothetical protein